MSTLRPAVAKLPIPPFPQNSQKALELLVDQLSAADAQKSEIEMLEQELNVLVYELYGLTKDEIAIVEEATR